jgi:hypothetical protein
VTAGRRAVIYVTNMGADLASAMRHCEERDLTAVSVICEQQDGQKWRAAYAVLAAGLADVLVVAQGPMPGMEIAGGPGRPQRLRTPPPATERRPARVRG